MLGAIGLFFSALIKRTQAATVLTYITVLAMIIGTTMLFIFWSVVVNQDENGGFGVGPPERAPEQLMYINPMVGMLDVVANTEPGGFGGINQMLAQLRGDAPNFGGDVVCQGDVCRPIDQFGNPVDDVIETGSGYWWPRVAITLGHRRRAAHAGRDAPRGPGRHALGVPAHPAGARPARGRCGRSRHSREHPIIQELREEPEPER